MGLHAKQKLAIAELVQGKTVAEVAVTVNRHQSTIYNWLRDDEFKGVLLDETNAIIHVANSRLVGLITLAVDALAEVLTTTESDNVKRLVAEGILDRVMSTHEKLNLIQRLNAIEERLGSNGGVISEL